MQVGVSVPITELGADLTGLRDFVQAAEDLGATHLSVGTGGGGLRSAKDHIDAIRQFMEVLNR